VRRDLHEALTAMTRRWFLKNLARAGAVATFGPRATWPRVFTPKVTRSTVVDGAQPVFEQIPPSASGISWVHSNGRSEEMYLPETVGAGCAFLD